MRILSIVTVLVVCGIVPGNPGRLISEKGVGPIRLGMTLGEARKAAPSATFERVGDGDGAALVQVTIARDVAMQVWADEEDPRKPIDWGKKIRTIETFSPAFRTATGAHPGMKVGDANRLYGRTKSVETTEIESRQFITFEKHPPGLLFRLDETGRALLSIAVSSSKDAS